jgi:hypothetical protein
MCWPMFTQAIVLRIRVIVNSVSSAIRNDINNNPNRSNRQLGVPALCDN